MNKPVLHILSKSLYWAASFGVVMQSYYKRPDQTSLSSETPLRVCDCVLLEDPDINTSLGTAMSHLQMTSPHQIPVQIAWGETCRCPIHVRIIPSAMNSGDVRLSSKLFREKSDTLLFPHHPPDPLKAIVDKNVCRIPAPMLSGPWVGYLPGMFFLEFRFSCHGDQPNRQGPKSGMTQR